MTAGRPRSRGLKAGSAEFCENASCSEAPSLAEGSKLGAQALHGAAQPLASAPARPYSKNLVPSGRKPVPRIMRRAWLQRCEESICGSVETELNFAGGRRRGGILCARS